MFGGTFTLAKGCERSYRARQWNQRYCQDPNCLRAVRRWQAAKRQRERRAGPEGRQKHAAADRDRRRRVPKPLPAGESPSAETAPPYSPWSRSKKFFPHRLCNRPGCYEPPRDYPWSPSLYCGEKCHKAMRRVKDRERELLRRKTKAGKQKRRLEYQALARKRLPLPPTAKHDPATCGAKLRAVNPRIAVGDSGRAGQLPYLFRVFRESPSMIHKRILVPGRMRRRPTDGWSWIDRRFVRDFAPRLSHEAIVLYYFLAAVADKDGLSFYHDATIAGVCASAKSPWPVRGTS